MIKDACGISFFKGVLLRDDGKLLVPAGENSHVARLLKVTTRLGCLDTRETAQFCSSHQRGQTRTNPVQ